MVMQYDNEIFQKYRNLAVTDVSDLKVGETYYTNSGQKEIKVLKILSGNEFDAMRGRDPVSGDEPRWIMTGPGDWDFESLQDSNVTNSYNPWMIFKNKEDMIACTEELIVTCSNDGWEDWPEDYDYDYDYDED